MLSDQTSAQIWLKASKWIEIELSPIEFIIIASNQLTMKRQISKTLLLASNFKACTSVKQNSTSKLHFSLKKSKSLLDQQASLQLGVGSISEYAQRLQVEKNLIKSYPVQIDQKEYVFDKILPLEQRINRVQEGLNNQVNYYYPSEMFTIFSPLFLNGLEIYLQSHPMYQQQRSKFISTIIKIDSNKAIDDLSLQGKEKNRMDKYSEDEEEFITFFLQKYGQQGELKEFLDSLLQLNYFSIKNIAEDERITSQIHSSQKGKYSSLYELYQKGTEELKEILISKILGKECLWGRYSKFADGASIQTPYCIKHNGKYIAILYLQKMNQDRYTYKLKNKSLVEELKRKGHSQALYVYSIYVLPKYKGQGHGKNIIQALKKSKIAVVLCSSATSSSSGLIDSIGTGHFYQRCDFKQYYPVQVQEEDQYDIGCMFTREEHKECSMFHCKHQVNCYQDESFYAFLPSQ